MKRITNIALAVAALIAGTAAHAAQTITNLPNSTSTNGSDLVLFVSDSNSGQYFTEDLGLGINSTVSKAGVTAASSSDLSFTTPAGITAVGGTGSALANFLTSSTVAADVGLGDVSWSILAADDTSSASTLGAERAVVSSQLDLSIAGGGTTFSNSNVHAFAAAANTFFTAINTGYAGGNTSTSLGWGAGVTASKGPVAPESFISPLLENGGLIGQSQSLYVFATNNNQGNGSDANVYIGQSVTVDAAGDITIAPVPLPAAVWLFGSGLLGLVGVGRRRISAAV